MPTNPVTPGLRCRQIAETDIDAVAALLARGFPVHDRKFWLDAFGELKRHESPPGLPRYGYLLENAGVIVGAVLLICTAMPAGDTVTTRCNLSSWYVDPEFRVYAAMLVAQALRHRDVTYINVSPAPHTRPIIEAQGFSRYCDGVFVAAPMFNGPFGGSNASVIEAGGPPDARFDVAEAQILAQHAMHGCISLWGLSGERAYPFVFRPRRVRRIVPCAQLIYCSDVADFVRFAGPIGRLLARRGLPFVIVDANGAIPGLFGWYSRGNMPKYFKGPRRPRLGDLAYTENAVMGV